ncbi:hypothetical protein ABIB40_001071 [Pedobacter sp. UYP30]|uniref:hypothetical protein n=1 Tax=Pedobacter sp. UYP30 TaxID=1756400 RepID=UPI003398646B
MKFFLAILSFICCAQLAFAQDFVVKNNGDVLRGTIRGTNTASVVIANENNEVTLIEAKDAKSFFWNGDSYVSKGFAGRRDLDFKFVKVLKFGKVNLYSIGGEAAPPIKQQKSVRFRPSVGIGTGGAGFGGGIVIGGGGNNQPDRPAGAPVIHYFIEKPGSGPMQEIPIKAITNPDKYAAVKSILLQKMGDSAGLKSQIESTTEFNRKEVEELVEGYNKGE